MSFIAVVDFRPLPGRIAGLDQPTVVVGVELAAEPPWDWAMLDPVINRLLGEPVPLHGEPDRGLARALWRLTHLQGSVQRHQKVPVFDTGRLLAMLRAKDSRRARALLTLPCHEPQATALAVNWAIQALDALGQSDAASPEAFARLEAGYERCVEQLRPYALKGINTFHFLRSAHALQMPVARLHADVYALGHGVHSRLLKRSMTDQTAAIGMGLAHSKAATAAVLRRHGLPVPRHCRAVSAADAIAAAAEFGYPVVVKPDDQEQGRGVSAGLRDAQAVTLAFEAARKMSPNILVEKHVEGADYRLTVFRGRVVKILHRRAGGVTGDGVLAVCELVRQAQQTPRMVKVLRQTGKFLLELDDEALGLLAEQGVTPDSVPAAGRFITLRRKSNISAGGIQTLVPLAQCHPDNWRMAVRACEAIRLDLCGVDLLIPDIARSWLETGAAIVELNGQPQIGWDQGPEAYAVILRELMRNQWDIPLHLAICPPGRDDDGPALAERLFPGCAANGVATAGGVWIDGQRVTATPPSAFDAAVTVLGDPAVTGAVIVFSPDDVAHYGLPAARFASVLVMQPAEPPPNQLQAWSRVRMVVAELGGGPFVLARPPAEALPQGAAAKVTA